VHSRAAGSVDEEGSCTSSTDSCRAASSSARTPAPARARHNP